MAEQITLLKLTINPFLLVACKLSQGVVQPLRSSAISAPMPPICKTAVILRKIMAAPRLRATAAFASLLTPGPIASIVLAPSMPRAVATSTPQIAHVRYLPRRIWISEITCRQSETETIVAVVATSSSR